MAHLRMDFFSPALGMKTSIDMVLPEKLRDREQIRVCYLLHGLSDNCSTWERYTSVDRYAEKYELAVVMPEVQRSWYADMKCGPAYFTYVSQELPEFVNALFRLSTRREDTMVAGLSISGYGALRCALGCPDRFGLCAAFSSACDIHRLERFYTDGPDGGEGTAILGLRHEIPAEMDLRELALQTAALASEKRPRLYMACGTEDFLIHENRAFRDNLRGLPGAPFQLTYEEWPGVHEWAFWDTAIQKAFAALL